jgi:chloramphenicol 3-O-phosphotransferase
MGDAPHPTDTRRDSEPATSPEMNENDRTKRGNAVGRLVILSGPSCMGKSPLRTALATFYPGLWSRLQKIVLFNSRAPRPGEREGVDYHFRSRTQVEEFRAKEHYAVLDVRGDVQALDVAALKGLLERVPSSRATRSSAACCRRTPRWPIWIGSAFFCRRSQKKKLWI